MQINPLHTPSHAAASPVSLKLTTPGNSNTDSETTGNHETELTSGIEILLPYTNRLQDIPEVRSEVVDAARTRLANGEYTTPEAAVETAAAILKRT